MTKRGEIKEIQGDEAQNSRSELEGSLKTSELEHRVCEAAIAWRLQAHSQNKVDDALWEAVNALIAACTATPHQRAIADGTYKRPSSTG